MSTHHRSETLGQESEQVSNPGYHFTPFHQLKDPKERAKLRYELLVRQEPKQSRMCGIGEKADRRPIDPPPIVELRVTGHEASDKSPGRTFAWLQNPCYFIYASLVTNGNPPVLHNLLSDGKTRTTTGSVVSNMYNLRDPETSKEGGFFIFPDLSVRSEGQYRLKMSLLEIVGNEIHHCASVYTGVFQVYSAKRFPGMEESTLLSKYFADQGLKIRMRREARGKTSTRSSKKHGRNSDEDDGRSSMHHGSEKDKSSSSSHYGSKQKAIESTSPGTDTRPRSRVSQPSMSGITTNQSIAGMSWDDVWANPLRVPIRGFDRSLPPLGQAPPPQQQQQQQQSVPPQPHHYPSSTLFSPNAMNQAATKLPSHPSDLGQDYYRYDAGPSSIGQSRQGKEMPNEASTLSAYLSASSIPDLAQQGNLMDPNFIPDVSNPPYTITQQSGRSSRNYSDSIKQYSEGMRQFSEGMIDSERSSLSSEKRLYQPPNSFMSTSTSPGGHVHHHHYHGPMMVPQSQYLPMTSPQYGMSSTSPHEHDTLNQMYYEPSRQSMVPHLPTHQPQAPQQPQPQQSQQSSSSSQNWRLPPNPYPGPYTSSINAQPQDSSDHQPSLSLMGQGRRNRSYSKPHR